MILRIVDELRDASESFRYRWDLYRMLFANAPTDLARTNRTATTGDPQDRLLDVRRRGCQEPQERLIANFLYLNGVDYLYERPYDVEVADATHSQYRPDFYYPTSKSGTSTGHWTVTASLQPRSGIRRGHGVKRCVHAGMGQRSSSPVGRGHVR